jgi:hypothetical protein
LGLLRGGVLCHGFHSFILYTYFHAVILLFPMTLGSVSHQPKYVYSLSINRLHLVGIHFSLRGSFFISFSLYIRI